MDATITNIKVAAYCAASVAFDQKQNIYDGFKPLVITAIAELAPDNSKQTISFNNLRNKINELYPVNINTAMLNRLLTALKKDGTIKEYRPRISITIENFEQTEATIANDNYGLHHFFSGFCDYLQQKGENVVLDQIQNDVCDLIFSKSTDLAEFLSKKLSRDDLLQNTNNKYIVEFLDYLLLCERERPDDVLSYKRLYNGAIQASLLGFSPNKVDDITGINITTVILDTNFIVRLLGLQTPIENDLAREMWDVLNNVGVEFVVLQSSIDEVRKSIKRFVAAYEPYQSGTLILRNQKIRSCGYLSAIQCGLTSLSQLQEYTQTANIRKAIEGQWKCSIFEDNYSSNEGEITELISAIEREGYGRDSAIHDLALTKHCIELRKEKQTFRNSAGNSLVWVLTEDNRLCKYCHQHATEVQECISETQLSNLMWLAKRKDSNNGLVSVIVALATKGMVTVEKYNSFIAKIHEYTRRKQNDHDALDCVAMVMANDILTTQDVNDVINGSLEVDSLIFDKSEELRQERITELRKHEDDMSRSQQELSRAEREKEEALENNRDLQRQIKDKESEAEQEKNSRINERRENELKNVQRNIKDIDRLSVRLDKIDKANGKKASFILVACYVLILVGVPIIVWKLGLLEHVDSILSEILAKSALREVFLTILPMILSAIWLLFVLSVPGIISLVKGRGFRFKPQFSWQLIKIDLSYRNVQNEIEGYEWFYDRIGNEVGLREMYYENDAGIDNIKSLIIKTRFDLNQKKMELDNLLIGCR